MECSFLAAAEAPANTAWISNTNMAASAINKKNYSDSTTTDALKSEEDSLPLCREIIKPTISELTKEVRKNILCTVEGCGKILPNTPALNMHLVKSHRIKVITLITNT